MLAAREEVRRDFIAAVATLARKLEREGGAEEGHRLRHEAQVRDRHAVVRSA